MTDEPTKPKKLRGFALMSKEKRTELARQGGASVPPENRGFSKNRKAAKEAGEKGGKSVPNWKRSFFTDRELASEAGSRGGKAVKGRKRKKNE